MAAPDPRIRQLKIKTGVVKRLTKEKTMYEKEAAVQEAKIEKMKAEGKDEHDIRKQGEVLLESKAMVPDTLKRLRNSYQDLKQLVMDYETDLGETEEYTQAQDVLKAADEMLSS